MQTDEEVFEEKIPNSYKKRSLIKEFMEMYPSISERMEELKQRPKDGNLIAGTDENYQKMWNLGVDMGLGRVVISKKIQKITINICFESSEN